VILVCGVLQLFLVAGAVEKGRLVVFKQFVELALVTLVFLRLSQDKLVVVPRRLLVSKSCKAQAQLGVRNGHWLVLVFGLELCQEILSA